MIFKRFGINCVLRVIGITLSLLFAVWMIYNTRFYISSSLVFLFVAYQTWSLVEYVEKTNIKLSRLISAIQNEDFALHFSDERKGYSFRVLSSALNDVVKNFGDSRREKEEALIYLQTVIEQSPVALMVFDKNEKISFFNKAAKTLTGLEHPGNLNDLSVFSKSLVSLLRSGQQDFQLQQSLKGYTLRTTRFGLYGDLLTLVSIQNIHPELDEKESDSWHKLLRVLTHEIMNSVTPITSIASTGEKIVASLDIAEKEDLGRSFETIKRRGEGLLHFTKAYRNFSSLPQAELQSFALKQMIDDILELLQHQLAQVKLVLEIPGETTVYGDRKLCEQVLINLLLNAVEALQDSGEATITISAKKVLNRQHISVSDNGKGIPQENLEKIFVPFFTTKAKGSGIGLSLSRELMRIQGGNIHVDSEEGKGTTVTLQLRIPALA